MYRHGLAIVWVKFVDLFDRNQYIKTKIGYEVDLSQDILKYNTNIFCAIGDVFIALEGRPPLLSERIYFLFSAFVFFENVKGHF